ncbi:MAG TPA: MFS transporter [Gaiellaceae bacterium]
MSAATLVGLRGGVSCERRFRLLLIARTTSFFGAGIAPIAVAFATLAVHSSPEAVALVVGARVLAQVVFMPAGGVWADRLPRHYVMVAADLVCGAAQAATAVLLLTGKSQMWELVALQAVGGAATAFVVPALQGVVPQIVPEEHRQQANALLGLARDGARIFGTAIGGMLVAALGGGWALGLDAMTFFVSALLLSRIRLPLAARVARPSVFRELGEGWREFRSRTWMWAIAAQFAVFNAIGMGSFFVLGPVVARRELGGAGGWSLVLAGQMIGLFVGGLLALRVSPRRPLLTAPLASILLAAPLIALGTHQGVLVIAVAAAASGAASAVFDVLFLTALQDETPEEKLSRVSSFTMLGAFASIPAGIALVGALGTWVGVDKTLILAAGMMLLAAVMVTAVPDVRRIRRARAAGVTAPAPA